MSNKISWEQRKQEWKKVKGWGKVFVGYLYLIMFIVVMTVLILSYIPA